MLVRYLDLQVDAVEQRARDAAHVVRDAAWAALAGLARRAAAALAGVHGGDQLDARGVGDAVVGPRNHGLAGLQRLAQGVEHVGQELRQLVEEEDAQVGERHLAGTRLGATADQGRHAGRMMRRAEGAAGGELAAHQLAGQRVHHGDFQHLLRRQRRQDGGQPRCQHRLAGARRADHQQVVSAGGGDLQHALSAFLALDVPEVGQRHGVGLHVGLGAGERLQAGEMVDEREQMGCGQHGHVLVRPGRLRAAGGGADQAFAHGVGADGGGESARHAANRGIERQLPDRRIAFDGVGRDGAHGHHHGERNRQVEVAALLREFCTNH